MEESKSISDLTKENEKLRVMLQEIVKTCENPRNRTSYSLLQACRFLDGIRLKILRDLENLK